MSDMGEVSWQIVLCLILAWIIVYLCLIKGVASSGKVSIDLTLLQTNKADVQVVRGCPLQNCHTIL